MIQALSGKTGPRHEPASSSAFRFRLLGPLEATFDDQPVPLPSHRVQGLLAFLLVYPTPQRRERLVGRLFPDMPEQRGRRRLSHSLWLLRQSLPQLPLETSSQEISLRPEARWLDVEAFRQAAAHDSLSGWLQALALYRGELVEDLYDDWLLAERESLYLHYVRLAHRACDELLARQRFAEVLPVVERLAQREPYDEHALRVLMRAYQAQGRRGAALAAYERFVSLAASDLGAEPEAATEALAQAMRTTRAPLAPQPGLQEVLPADESDDRPASGGADSPKALVQRANNALARGDQAAVAGLIRRLRTRQTGREDEIRLLEIDVALFFEEYKRARQLLEISDPEQLTTSIRIARLALVQRRTAEAHDAAMTALMKALEAGDRWTELEALLVLTQAQRRLGQGVQAARSAEQALNLARTCKSPVHIARALVIKGHNHVRQGQYAQALTLYHEARSLAHEHGLRRNLAEVLHWIAWIQSYQGALLDALATGHEALCIWRDLGVTGREASTLQSLAYTLAQLGRTAESLRALEQASRLCEQMGEPVRVAVNQYHLADTLLYHDDAQAPQAAALIHEALTAFQVHDQPGWAAAAWDTLGRALWLSGQYPEALDAFQQARQGYVKTGELAFLPELMAREGLAYLGLGETAQALDATRQAIAAMAQGEVSDEAVPEIYYARAMALAADGREAQAHGYLTRAYACLLTRAAPLKEEEARQAFFHHCPSLRRLMRELYARGIVPAPEAGVVSCQLHAARGGVPVRVRWTLDAGPADESLGQAQGAIALRRARVSRLIEEARAQGAAPTAADLAEALGVSKRTIQRDLAALRP